MQIIIENTYKLQVDLSSLVYKWVLSEHWLGLELGLEYSPLTLTPTVRRHSRRTQQLHLWFHK